MGGAHTGIEQTFARISSLIVWDDMLQDIAEYVTSCHICQAKSNRNKPPPGQIRDMPIERLIWGRVGIGRLWGAASASVHLCLFKVAKMVATADKSATTVARAFF